MPARGRSTRILVAYTVALAAWCWFATAIGPGLVASGFEGRGSPWVNHAVRLFTHAPRTPVALEEWRIAWKATALALACHAGFVLTLSSWGRRVTVVGRDAMLDRATIVFLGVASLAFMLLTVFSGLIQDYYLYSQIWTETLRGHDPWFLVFGQEDWFYSLNSYGPLYNALALPAGWSMLAPKVLFAAAYWFAVAWLILAVGRPRGLTSWGGMALALWFANPFAWVEIALFGHFDVLVAILSIAAVEARIGDRPDASAGCLATGGLLKFIPMVYAPFLALDRGRLDRRYLAIAFGAFGAGMAAALAYWGPSTFRPFTLTLAREPAHLSIFKYLEGPRSPIGRDTLLFSPRQYATPVLFFALYEAWRWAKRARLVPAGACVLATTVMLAFYKVGFPQYYMILYLIVPYWLLRGRTSPGRRAWPWASYLLLFEWIAAFDVDMVRDRITLKLAWVGLPTFVMMMGLLAGVVLAVRREPDEAEASVPQ